jgi:PDZ domain-containing protein
VTTVVETLQAAETAHGDPGRPDRTPTRTFVWVVAGLILLQLVAGLVAASSITVPYYAIKPGRAQETNGLIVLPADKRFQPAGHVLFVTVGLQPLRAFQYLLAKRDPDVQVVSEKAILGTANPQQYRQQSVQAMVDSKEAAEVVALKKLCLPVIEKGTGARIEQVVKDSPAAAAGIRPEDTITAIGSTPVTTADQVLVPLRAKKPGETFSLTVEGPVTGEPPRTVSGTLGTNPSDATRSYLGVVLRTRAQDYDLPFDVKVESGRVGGPSAGLAFTLALLDQLTKGELTGGRTIAATGTIELDQRVGEVGGVPQKAVAVRRSGATLFLVPTPELVEAKRKVGPKVEVVPVDTLDQALQALRDRGGDTSGIPASCPGS